MAIRRAQLCPVTTQKESTGNLKSRVTATVPFEYGQKRHRSIMIFRYDKRNEFGKSISPAVAERPNERTKNERGKKPETFLEFPMGHWIAIIYRCCNAITAISLKKTKTRSISACLGHGGLPPVLVGGRWKNPHNPAVSLRIRRVCHGGRVRRACRRRGDAHT